MLLLSVDDARNQTESIVDLVRFSYSNVNTRDTEVGQDIDSLRRMVIHFVACVFEKIGMNESFLVLMEEGGPLARDLASMLAKRITL
ncbi:uncharacterized protein LY89DRAFT_117356 [Mollisia scopiformis]|uniref:Uncharacterized protein n=1 Tax=Mollisia scopiformis TaxID=149040 RepID=A0A194X3K9_MOLSC|nr:uncharacterized protein LY89DRAFT_117356 [Mollisia scopiformis]KUJ14614.1 hypothetical protein LY89DRAFT_117356 [Mollisia scopiformis]